MADSSQQCFDGEQHIDTSMFDSGAYLLHSKGRLQ